MDYLRAFDVSAAGMSVERVRLDTTAMNLANAHTTQSANGKTYRPMQVVVGPRPLGFEAIFASQASGLQVPSVVSINEQEVAPRVVYEPGHPDADEKGYVSYPNVNTVTEMVNLISTTRAYEANVRAMNAAKTMALKALEIGGAQ